MFEFRRFGDASAVRKVVSSIGVDNVRRVLGGNRQAVTDSWVDFQVSRAVAGGEF